MFFINRQGEVGTFKSTPEDWLPSTQDSSEQREQHTITNPHELVLLTCSHAQQVLQTMQYVDLCSTQSLRWIICGEQIHSQDTSIVGLTKAMLQVYTNG